MWVFGVLVVVALIAIGVHSRNVKNAALEQAGTTDDSVLNASEDVSEGSVDAPASTNTGTPATLSYASALVKYAKTRFQFDETCQASPTAETFKSGVNVMLDNRSANALSLHLGTIGTFSVKPWGFKIVRLTGTPLPATILVDCNTSQNVASITLQK